jgi:hypothetical protein
MHLGRWRVVAAAVAVSAATSVPASARGRECPVETRLQWVDVIGLAPFAYTAMAAEAGDILAEHGVCADIARASPRSVRTSAEIGVILLRTMGGSGVGRRVLGATKSRDARNASVWVYFDEVASAVGLGGRPTETWSGRERATFARALGRVAAHEVIHVLLPQRPHDETGLMASSFGPRQLSASALSAHPGILADVRRRAPQRLSANAHGRPQEPGTSQVRH